MVWHSSLKIAEIRAIERVEKVALKIILSENYQSYVHVHALRVTDRQTYELSNSLYATVTELYLIMICANKFR